MRFTSILIIIIFNISCLFSQDVKKLSKKDANEEVKRLTILIENLELENNELNNKLMIEYEKLLSEMDENSNLRIQNGEFRDEIRTMQEELIELQRSISKKESEINILTNKISNYKSKLLSDSISIIKFDNLTQKQIIQLEKDSIVINNLRDSLDKSNNYILSLENINDNLKNEHLSKNWFYFEKNNLIHIDVEDPNNKNNTLVYYIRLTEDKEAILSFVLFKINYDKCIENLDVKTCVDVLISQCFMNDEGPTKRPGPGEHFLWDNRCADEYLGDIMSDYLQF